MIINYFRLTLLFTLFCCLHSSFSKNQLETTKLATIVQVGIYVIHIDKIDVKTQTFNAEFYLNMKWVGDRNAEFFELVNASDFSKYFFDKWVERDTNFLACKIRGSFRCPMDVSHFPLDRQTLVLQISDFIYIEDSLGYLLNNELTGTAKLSSPEWYIIGHTAKIKSIKEMESNFSCIEFLIEVDRKTTSFLIKIFIPILIVMGVSMLNLFLPKKEIETCIALGVTSLLSIIALHYSISDDLPEVNYATTVDRMMIGSYFFIFIVMIEIVVAYNLIQKKAIYAEKILEKYSKIIIPCGYLFFLISLFFL